MSDECSPYAFSMLRATWWSRGVNGAKWLWDANLPSFPPCPEFIKSQRPRPEMGALV